MAIEKIKKVLIVGEKEKELQVLSNLFNLSLVHIDKFDSGTLNDIGHFTSASPSKSFEDDSHKIDAILSIFKIFGLGSKGFFQSFFPEDISVSRIDFERITKTFGLDGIYGEAITLNNRYDALTEEEVLLSSERGFLLLFKDFPFQYSILQGTENTKSFLGTLKSKDLIRFEANEKSFLDGIYFFAFNITKTKSSVFALYLSEDESKMQELVKTYGIERVAPPNNVLGFNNEEVSRVSARLREIEQQKNIIISKIKELYEIRVELIIYSDFIQSLKNKEESLSNFINGKEVFVLKGFVKQREVHKILKVEESGDCHVFLSDPEPTDFVPVSLANNPIFKPFEMLIGLFGVPSYNNIDPTPIVAIFFSTFFGIALGDAFYGLILALFGFYFLRKYRENQGANKFFSILLYGGITSIIVGVLTGSFAGNFLSVYFPNFVLTKALEKTTLINTGSPDGSVKFLIFALGVGILSQLIGILLSIIVKLKNKDYLNAIFNGLGWLLLFPGLILLLVLSKVPSLKMFDNFLIVVGLFLVLAGGWISIRTPIFKPIASLVNLYGIRSSYGISGFLGDVLSYLRLFALGLSSSILASSFNLMARVIGNLFGNFGIVPVVLILVAMHSLAFVMNILGAFIHSMRLNFLEFFGRFYDTSGNQFKPLGFDFKNIRIKKE